MSCCRIGLFSAMQCFSGENHSGQFVISRSSVRVRSPAPVKPNRSPGGATLAGSLARPKAAATFARQLRIAVGETVSTLQSFQSIQNYAKLAGILGIFSFLGGGFGEAYVPSVIIVAGDAAATTGNIVASELLYRLGFAAYLIEAICDVGLTWAFYILLKPVHRRLALLSVFFRLIATGGFAMSQALRYSALPIALGPGYLETFSAAQRESLALLAMNAGGVGLELFSMFYGVGAIVLGYLIYRSNYLPWILGALL